MNQEELIAIESFAVYRLHHRGVGRSGTRFCRHDDTQSNSFAVYTSMVSEVTGPAVTGDGSPREVRSLRSRTISRPTLTTNPYPDPNPDPDPDPDPDPIHTHTQQPETGRLTELTVGLEDGDVIQHKDFPDGKQPLFTPGRPLTLTLTLTLTGTTNPNPNNPCSPRVDP